MKYLAAFKLRSPNSGDGGPVFSSKRGQPLTHRNASRRGFEKAAEHAQIEGVSFHSMRHAFASRMIARGISSTVLAKIMGHESSAITEKRYIHLFDRVRTDDAVREAMAWGWKSGSSSTLIEALAATGVSAFGNLRACA